MENIVVIYADKFDVKSLCVVETVYGNNADGRLNIKDVVKSYNKELVDIINNNTVMVAGTKAHVKSVINNIDMLAGNNIISKDRKIKALGVKKIVDISIIRDHIVANGFNITKEF